jgi:signal transduction histidine kinase
MLRRTAKAFVFPAGVNPGEIAMGGLTRVRDDAGHKGELLRVDFSHLRLLGEMRVVLSLVALLLLILLEASGSARLLLVTALLSYSAYSFAQLWQLNRGRGQAYLGMAHWVDATCYGFVVAMTGGFASHYFLLLLFPVIVASTQWGFRRGALVALSCTLLFFAIGGIQTWQLPEFDWIRHLLSPAGVLLLVGLVIARWGKSESTLKRRLAFSNDLNRLSSARYGFHQVMYKLAEILCTYQRADACIVVTTDSKSDGCLLYDVKAGVTAERLRGQRVSKDTAESMLALPPDHVVLYSRRPWRLGNGRSSAYDSKTLERRRVKQAPLAELANLLETDSFISLRIRAPKQTLGRLYLTSSRLRFTRSDVGFLVQAVDQAALVIKNMHLLDRLVFDAATDQRKKISRDLHDGTIQPYIGLKLGLEALRRKRGMNDAFASELDQLAKIAEDGIGQLRRYVGSLRDEGSKNGHDLLLPAVRRQAEKFTEFYGIDVQVVGDSEIVVQGRLLNEVMHIIREGLSNIRRHTTAEHAAISLRDDNGRLVLEFVQEDNNNGHNGSVKFFPRSLNERTRELGGRVNVEQRPRGQTAVMVEIPL